MRNDLEIIDEIKEEMRADIEDELLSEQQHLVDEIATHKQEVTKLQNEKAALHNDLDAIEGKRMTLETIKGYKGTPSKLNNDNVVIPLTQYNNLRKTAIEGAQSAHQKKEQNERKKLLDTREKELAEKESSLLERESTLNNMIAEAKNETAKYQRLYNQERNGNSDLLSQVTHHKSESKRWEDSYNGLYSQHVKLKRGKGLDIGK